MWEKSLAFMVWGRCPFVGWGGDAYVGSSLRAVDVRKHDCVWGLSRAGSTLNLGLCWQCYVCH